MSIAAVLIVRKKNGKNLKSTNTSMGKGNINKRQINKVNTRQPLPRINPKQIIDK